MALVQDGGLRNVRDSSRRPLRPFKLKLGESAYRFKESKEEMMLILKSVPMGGIGRREVFKEDSEALLVRKG